MTGEIKGEVKVQDGWYGKNILLKIENLKSIRY